jgi:hypothetical protein
MQRFFAPALLATLAVVGILAASSWAAPRQQAGCGTAQCAYLAVVQKPLPSPTPTDTPIPTVTPITTATVQPPPPGVSVLPNHSIYVDSIDYLHVVGEIFNNTSKTITFAKVSVDFYNVNNQLVGTDYTYTWLDKLRAGDKTCFKTGVKQPAGWASYRFEVVTYSNTTAALPNLTLTSDSGSIDQFDYYHIIGEVRNDSATKVTFVEPVGTLYNAAGAVVGCDFTFVNSTDLNPGQSSAFDMQFVGRNYNDVASHRIQIDGNVQ